MKLSRSLFRPSGRPSRRRRRGSLHRSSACPWSFSSGPICGRSPKRSSRSCRPRSRKRPSPRSRNPAQTRTKVLGMVEQARTSIAGHNPAMGEAYLISSLETGRELTAGRNGMLITRLTGIACQKAALKELAALYTNTGNHSRLQVTQGHLAGPGRRGQRDPKYSPGCRPVNRVRPEFRDGPGDFRRESQVRRGIAPCRQIPGGKTNTLSDHSYQLLKGKGRPGVSRSTPAQRGESRTSLPF